MGVKVAYGPRHGEEQTCRTSWGLATQGIQGMARQRDPGQIAIKPLQAASSQGAVGFCGGG